MSQVETIHDTPEIGAIARNGHFNGESSRDATDAGSAIKIVAQRDHVLAEAESMCAVFLVKLSHDMRMPLSSILGVTQMLLDTSLSDSQKESAEAVAESANALTAMAGAIADFSSYLGSRNTSLEAHRIELKGNGSGAFDSRADPRANGNGAEPVVHPADPSSGGATDVLAKTPTEGNRPDVLSARANFSTRVPPDTAKLIRILVAEDHVMNQHVMLRMLARLGYKADAVGNGLEAVAALTRSPYDIVLMDCQMPQLDGYEATRQIRKSGGRFGSTPIIAVTANAMDDDREKCLASGMSDYMSKPVLAQTLASTLEKWILPDAAVGVRYQVEAPPASPSLSDPVSENGAQGSETPPASDENVNAAVQIEKAVSAAALETLRSMDAGDEGFMVKIIELFLADLGERIAALKAAAETRDGDALKRIAHALKGSCGHFGATHLAALCRRTEQIGAQQPVSDASEIILELGAEARRVRIALEAAKESQLRIPQ